MPSVGKPHIFRHLRPLAQQAGEKRRLEAPSRRGAGGLALVLVCLVGGVLAVRAARAQISPGELSAAHAALDGSGDCLECHAQRRGVDPALCLECHELLDRRIDAGLGLHARAEYEDCATCHIEHHGRDFDLIWWGDAGEAAFDHASAGYELAGAHGRVACRGCHRAESIAAAKELSSRGKDLGRTFLGLVPACLSCHADEHRGQVDADGCLSCHAMAAWLPAAWFDHDATRFALTGRHQALECTSCHGTLDPLETGGESALRFAVAAFRACGDCHQDPHRGRLGTSCADCHGTEGWRRVDRGSFDHDRTRFRLQGRHREVDCQRCHRPGAPMRVERFERCRDCHDDAHLGQFADRAGGGDGCESCHQVRGFRPSEFGVEEHQVSTYPLRGSHLAVPCDACHGRVDPGRLAELPVATAPPPVGGRATVQRFRFASTRCRDCHADPHRHEVRELVEAEGCESCHSLAGWRRIEFDHRPTGFLLEAGHAGLGCGQCHEAVTAAPGEAAIRLSGAGSECAGCHEDPHRGQFADAGRVACDRCHGVDRWQELRFDHQVDSIFALEGAHRRVECRQCHLLEEVEGQSFARFKPLATDCESCHGLGPES